MGLQEIAYTQAVGRHLQDSVHKSSAALAYSLNTALVVINPTAMKFAVY